MPQSGFQIKSGLMPANSSGCEVSAPSISTARPSLVTLESGIQAFIEITGFTYIQGVPLAIAGFSEEDEDLPPPSPAERARIIKRLQKLYASIDLDAAIDRATLRHERERSNRNEP